MKLNFAELDYQTKKAKTRRTKPRGTRIPKSILGQHYKDEASNP